MSYILDALNKSEQDRKRRSSPALDALHGPPPVPRRRSMVPWAAAFTLLIAVNAAFIGWWFTRDDARGESPEPALPANETSRARPDPISREPASTPPVRESVEPSNVREATPTAEPPAVAAETGTVITPDLWQNRGRSPSFQPVTSTEEVISISQLPQAVRDGLPALSFSSHIYADAPDFRMVNINGRSLREGDEVEDGLRIAEITEDGVILDDGTHRFEVGVLEDWSGEP